MNEIRSIVGPILQDSYGLLTIEPDTYPGAFVDDVVKRAETYEGEQREKEIMLCIWNWMPGGDTAQVVAKKIADALEVTS